MPLGPNKETAEYSEKPEAFLGSAGRRGPGATCFPKTRETDGRCREWRLTCAQTPAETVTGNRRPAGKTLPWADELPEALCGRGFTGRSSIRFPPEILKKQGEGERLF